MQIISLSVSNLCLFKEKKSLTLTTFAPDFPLLSTAKLNTKIKGARASHSLSFLKLDRYDKAF